MHFSCITQNSQTTLYSYRTFFSSPLCGLPLVQDYAEKCVFRDIWKSFELFKSARIKLTGMRTEARKAKCRLIRLDLN